MIQNYFLFIFRNFSNKKLRGFLTILGIFIGIASVVALISISYGMELAIKEQFNKMGSDKLILMPGVNMFMTMMSDVKFTDKDIGVVEKVRGVDIVAKMVYSSMNIKFHDETKQTIVIGFPTDDSIKVLDKMEQFKIVQGNEFSPGDRQKIVLGSILNQEKGFFTDAVELKDKIEIQGMDFKVVGILSSIGNPQDDAQVYIPLEMAREMFDKQGLIDLAYVQLKEGYNTSIVSEDIKKALRKYRGEKEGEETFAIQTFAQIAESMNIILSIIRIVLIGIAAISLVVGGIGIMNTMYTSVLERTKEIGIMKAVGARNSDILIIFLIESGIYGLLGGLLGVFSGWLVAFLTQFVARTYFGVSMFQSYFSWWIVVLALAFSFVVGCVSGISPAIRASRLRPVQALRAIG